MAEHTPTPWMLSLFHPRLVNGGPDCREIAKTSFGYDSEMAESSANAAHIVKCVNSHDALVQMLKEARLQIDYLNKKFIPTFTSEAVLARIDAALASAQSVEGE